MRVHLLQYDISWHQVDSNISSIKYLLDSVTVMSGDWIILPEMWSTGFTMTPDQLDTEQLVRGIKFLEDYSHEHKVHIGGSQAFYDGECWRNRFFHYQSGILKGFYDKRYLYSPAGENKAYTPGQKPVIWSMDEFTIRPLICYDLRFAPWSFSPSAQVIIYVANWPETRITQWDALLRARAIENQAYVIGVNRIGEDQNNLVYNGHSALYKFDGQCISISHNIECVQTVELDLQELNSYRAQLPFLQDR